MAMNTHDKRIDLRVFLETQFSLTMPAHMNDEMVVALWEMYQVAEILMDDYPRFATWVGTVFSLLLDAAESYALTIEQIQAKATEMRAVGGYEDVDAWSA